MPTSKPWPAFSQRRYISYRSPIQTKTCPRRADRSPGWPGHKGSPGLGRVDRVWHPVAPPGLPHEPQRARSVTVAAEQANRGRSYDQYRQSAATLVTDTEPSDPPTQGATRNAITDRLDTFWVTKRIHIARYNHKRGAFAVAKIAGNRSYLQTTTTAVRESLVQDHWRLTAGRPSR